MATVEQAPAESAPQPAGNCRRCGAQVTPDQLVCVQCGTPVAMGFRRPPSWRLPAALIAGVVLVAGLAAGFVVSELLQDPDDDGNAPTVAAKPRPQTPPPAATTPTTPPPATSEPGTDTTPGQTNTSPSTTPEPGDTDAGATIRSWPSGKSAFTIILVSAKSKSQADDRAREAVDNDIPAGVLRSDDYEGLKPGFWVVFAGDFDNQRQADRRLDEYARKGFKGAYPRFIDASNKQPGD